MRTVRRPRSFTGATVSRPVYRAVKGTCTTAGGRDGTDARTRRGRGDAGRGASRLRRRPARPRRPAGRERAGERPGDGCEDRGSRRSGRQRTAARVSSRRGEQPDGEQRADEADAAHVEGGGPDGPRVAAGAQAVERRRRVDGEGEHVDPPPEAMADPLPQARADPHGEEQVERDDAEAHPQGAVVGRERHDHGLQAEVGERVDRDCEDVDDDEDEGQQRDVAVQLVGDETWPATRLPAVPEDEPEGHGPRQEDVRDEAARPRRVPGDRAPAAHGPTLVGP